MFSGDGSGNKSNIFGSSASGIFGQTPKPSASGSLFGGSSTTGTSTGLFGGSGSASAPTSGSLFGGGQPSTAPSPTGLFGGSSLGTNTAAPSANSLFGGASSAASNVTKPPDQSTAGTAGTSLFSPPNTSTAGSTTLGSGLFGLPAKPAEGSAPASGSTTAGTTAPSPFSGGLFGKPAATTSAPTAPATFSLGGSKDAAAPPAPPTSLFGNLGGSTKPTEKPDAKPATATFGLFGAPKTDEKKDSTTVAPTFGLGKAPSKEGEKPADTPGTGSSALTAPSNLSSTVVAVPPPSMLRGKTIEEIVNRWSSELENHVREFNRFAGEVSVWDRALIENGNNLAALYSHVLAAEREQNDIDQSLDHIEQQQKDLGSTLDAYEKATQETLGGQGGSLRALDTGPADTERDKNYVLATDLHTHLDDLSGSLTQMIDSVNMLSLPQKPNSDSEAGDDPMAQIAQILSSHLESLQWIDAAVHEVDGKVSEVEKRVKDSGHSSGIGMRNRGFGLTR